MNLYQMQERVRAIVDDDTLVETWGLDLFNQGLGEVASVVNLPALDTWNTLTVAALASNAALPDGFMRELHTVRDNARPDVPIKIVSSLKALTDEYGVLGDETGPIEACCEEGGTLYYAPWTQEEAELTVGYYREPTVLAEPTDVPSDIPSAFHASILVNYVAWKLYEMLEDGMSGEAVMSQRYGNNFQQALAMLAERYKDTSRKHIRRQIRPGFF